MTQAQDSEQPDKRLDEDPQYSTREGTPSPKPESAPRNWRKFYTVVSLVYANFWIAASVSLQAPFFPREAEAKGATPTQYGLVFGVFELVVIIMSPIYGKIIPKVSPKFLITAGTILGGAACCVFGILDKVPAGNKFIALAFIVRIFEGFGAAAIMTASFTIVASAFPESVATSFSLMETAFGLGLIVGPTIGGALYQVGGYLLPFVVNGAFLLLGGVILGFLLPKIEDAERHTGSRNLLSFLLDGGIISFTLSIITSLLLIGFNAATLEPHLRQFNLKPVILGVIFVITGGIYAITTPIWGKICDRGVNPLTINIFGYILTSIGIIFLGPMPFIPLEPTLGIVIGSLVVVGLGLSAKLVSSFVGALQNTIRRGFPDNLATYGMVSALFSTACSTGFSMDPISADAFVAVEASADPECFIPDKLPIIQLWNRSRRALSHIQNENPECLIHDELPRIHPWLRTCSTLSRIQNEDPRKTFLRNETLSKKDWAERPTIEIPEKIFHSTPNLKFFDKDGHMPDVELQTDTAIKEHDMNKWNENDEPTETQMCIVVCCLILAIGLTIGFQVLFRRYISPLIESWPIEIRIFVQLLVVCLPFALICATVMPKSRPE